MYQEVQGSVERNKLTPVLRKMFCQRGRKVRLRLVRLVWGRQEGEVVSGEAGVGTAGR